MRSGQRLAQIRSLEIDINLMTNVQWIINRKVTLSILIYIILNIHLGLCKINGMRKGQEDNWKKELLEMVKAHVD